MDLHTGQIIATQEPEASDSGPVWFYVPDWWDLHEASQLPGSMHWRSADYEWPVGDFGFVWDCL